MEINESARENWKLLSGNRSGVATTGRLSIRFDDSILEVDWNWVEKADAGMYLLISPPTHDWVGSFIVMNDVRVDEGIDSLGECLAINFWGNL
jgi:hypothetical protein